MCRESAKSTTLINNTGQIMTVPRVQELARETVKELTAIEDRLQHIKIGIASTSCPHKSDLLAEIFLSYTHVEDAKYRLVNAINKL